MTITAKTTALGKDYFVALETRLESITNWRAELPALGWEGGADTTNRKERFVWVILYHNEEQQLIKGPQFTKCFHNGWLSAAKRNAHHLVGNVLAYLIYYFSRGNSGIEVLFLFLWWRGRRQGMSCMKYDSLGRSEGSAVSDAEEQEWHLLLTESRGTVSQRWLCTFAMSFFFVIKTNSFMVCSPKCPGRVRVSSSNLSSLVGILFYVSGQAIVKQIQLVPLALFWPLSPSSPVCAFLCM